MHVRCLILGLLAAAVDMTHAAAVELQKENDPASAATFATLELLVDETLISGLNIRIFRAGELKECGSGQEASTCPRSQLLIVASFPGGGPGQPVLWRTDRRIGWGFVSQIELGGADDISPSGDFGTIRVEVKACEAPPAVETGELDPRSAGWWKELHYELVVGWQEAKIFQLSDFSDAPLCALY